MRTIAGIVVVVIMIAVLGLPLIGFMIVAGLFMLLMDYAAGGNKK